VNTQATGAIVIGGEYRGLGVVRSLGRRGIPVDVFYDEHRLGCMSRYTSRSFAWPTAADEDQQIDYLLDMADQHHLRDWVVFPTGDETAALMARHHERLSRELRLTTPPWQILQSAYDKRLTYQLAEQLGLDCPWTVYPRSRADVEAVAGPFPLILKPAIKPQANALTVAKAWRADDRTELLARYDAARQLIDPDLLMIQELIPGTGEAQLSCAALCVDGEPRVSIVARRLRQYPMDFGRSSTYVETTEDEDVELVATRLLKAMRWTGLIEVEFKRDPRDGRNKVLDLNPRVWGWHTLGQRAGADFTYWQWRLAHGELPPRLRARTGVRWVRLITDVPTAAREVWRGRLSLADYLRSLRGPLECATLAADDPLPALAELPLGLQMAWSRATNGRGREQPMEHGTTASAAV
jgi:predicted ATP-grasp superfamily ATP-dependent carboligase